MGTLIVIRNYIKNAGIILIGLIALCMLFACSSQPSPTIIATATPSSTSTPTLTATLSATYTPTATPTRTPKPTPTPRWTEDEQACIDAISALSGVYVSLGNEFLHQMELTSASMSLMYDEQWMKTTFDILDRYTATNAAVRAIECPNTVGGVQIHMEYVADHLDRFVTLYREGHREYDVDKLIDSTDEIRLAADSLAKALELLKELQGQ